jgi:hypothetical protein
MSLEAAPWTTDATRPTLFEYIVVGTVALVIFYCCCRNCVHAVIDILRCLCCCCCCCCGKKRQTAADYEVLEEGGNGSIQPAKPKSQIIHQKLAPAPYETAATAVPMGQAPVRGGPQQRGLGGAQLPYAGVALPASENLPMAEPVDDWGYAAHSNDVFQFAQPTAGQPIWAPPPRRAKNSALVECTLCGILFLLLLGGAWWLECEEHAFHHTCPNYIEHPRMPHFDLPPVTSYYVQHLLDNSNSPHAASRADT